MKFYFALISMLFLNSVFAQDTIVMQDGSEIQSKVTEITTTEIKYKRFDNLDGPLISILKTDVFMIKYQNGTKEMIQGRAEVVKSDSMDIKHYNQGCDDAVEYFPTGSAFAGSFLPTVLITPVGGLVTSIIISSSTPKEVNFATPNPKFLSNDYYKRGYQKTAKSKKQGVVWRGFAVGVLVDVVLITLLL